MYRDEGVFWDPEGFEAQLLGSLGQHRSIQGKVGLEDENANFHNRFSLGLAFDFAGSECSSDLERRQTAWRWLPSGRALTFLFLGFT